ncbi:MAG: ComF family protein [Pseudomonadota bacterium]
MKPQFLQVAANVALGAWRRSLDTVMPPICPVSGESVAAPGQLSPRAWAALHFIEAPYCARCGIPFAADYGDSIECPSCIAEPPAFDQARAATVYDDASHKLIVGFKHSDRTELAPIFGQWLLRAGANIISPDSILAPAPLHQRRLLARRYNQSAILAKWVANYSGARFAPDLLTRIRATPPQKNLSADARKRNVAGAFAISKNGAALITNAHIVLIDDVLTTGATLSACARALKKAGAARVDALLLARVVKGGIGAI